MESAENKNSVPEPAGAETPAGADSGAVSPPESAASRDSYNYYDDYGYEGSTSDVSTPADSTLPAPVAASTTSPPPPPVPPEPKAPGEEEEDGMLRMSFLEHLEELRMWLLRTLMGIGVAFLLSLIFAEKLWRVISDPATDALTKLGFKEPKLAILTPMEGFNVIYIKVPILAAIFLSSPWVLYQVWAFIALGLYRRERRWAIPFVLGSASLFIMGGLFAYFVAFRFGLEFLLGIGRDVNVLPIVSITEYFDLFVNVSLGIGLVFELPVLIFFLSLLRIVTPRFLLRNARYAILLITILAAILTPTPDVVNLTLFALPMVLLYFVGIFLSYLLLLHREHRRFPWWLALVVFGALLLLVVGAVYGAVTYFGLRFVRSWPFLVR